RRTPWSPSRPHPLHGVTGDQDYANLRGPFGRESLGVWAQCVFADPVAGLAVLGPSIAANSSHEAIRKRELFQVMVEDADALRFADPARPHEEVPAYVRRLDGEWRSVTVTALNIPRISVDPSNIIEPAMAGSPILSAAGDV